MTYDTKTHGETLFFLLFLRPASPSEMAPTPSQLAPEALPEVLRRPFTFLSSQGPPSCIRDPPRSFGGPPSSLHAAYETPSLPSNGHCPLQSRCPFNFNETSGSEETADHEVTSLFLIFSFRRIVPGRDSSEAL